MLSTGRSLAPRRVEGGLQAGHIMQASLVVVGGVLGLVAFLSTLEWRWPLGAVVLLALASAGETRLPSFLHAADIWPAITRGAWGGDPWPTVLRTAGERHQDEHHHEPYMAAHCAEIGSSRLGSLFLTLPTRGLTGLKVIRCPEGSVSLRWGGIRRGRSNACAVRSEWPVYGEK